MSFSTLSLISASKLQHRPGCFQEQLVCLWCLVPSTGNSCIHIFIAPHRAICHCCSGSLFTVFLFEFKFVLLCVLSIVFPLPCELICHVVHVRFVLLFFFIYIHTFLMILFGPMAAPLGSVVSLKTSNVWMWCGKYLLYPLATLSSS